MIEIVYNKLLAGWYVVCGLHQTPLSGRFDTKEQAKAWLARHRQAFKAVGIPDAEAQAAAEEIAGEISDMRLLKWMVGGVYVLLTVIGVPSIWLLLRVAAKVGALGT